MNTAIILRLVFSAAIMLNFISKEATEKNLTSLSISIQPKVKASPKNEDTDTIKLPPAIADTGKGQHHDHEDAHVLFFNFERIRKRKTGFSIRCTCVRTLFVAVHLLLFIMMFLHTKDHTPHTADTQHAPVTQGYAPQEAGATFLQHNTIVKISR